MLWFSGMNLAGEQETAQVLRYDLRAGDHLVYRQELESESAGGAIEALSHRSWTNHVVVLEEQRGGWVTGFQRNRNSYQLERFLVRGQDRLPQQQQAEAPLLPRSARYAEGNRLTTTGVAQFTWQLMREAPSKVLYDIHELPPLPEHAVRPGDTWSAPTYMKFAFRALHWEALQGEQCLLIEGLAAEEKLRWRYWFCPASGTARRMEFEATYGGMVLNTIRQKLRVELIERRREENVEDWLADPDLRQGVLAALLVSDTLPVDVDTLYDLLDGSDIAVQRKVLALAYRRGLQAPALDRLQALQSSESARVRTLVARMLEPVSRDKAWPLVERALSDSDVFVRDAALDWVRRRLPPQQAVNVMTPEQARGTWAALRDLPWPAKTQEPTNCGQPEVFFETLQRRHRAAWQPEGVSIRSFAAGPFRGWPYFVQVPEDYRGDRPFPVLIYLSGNNGPAIDGAQLASSALGETGYLAVYPHAGSSWWYSQPTAVMHALLDELLRQYNVDTDRIYLTGLSNGGTGTFYYAALWPHRFTAAVSAMGAGFYVEFDENPEGRPFAANTANLPMLFLHGEKDETIQASATRETVEQLRPHWAALESHIFPEREHEIVLGRGDDGMTLQFFERFRRQAFPRALSFETRTLNYPRHYWVEVLEKEAGVAEVKARIRDGNTVELKTKNVLRLRLLLRPELFPAPGPLRVLLNGREVFSGEPAHACSLLQKSLEAAADPHLAWSAELAFDVPR